MTVSGVNRLSRKLRRTIPDNIIKAARQALEKNADELVAEMRRLVPVDQGDLRDSIGWTWGDPPKGSITVGHVSESADSALRITVFAGGGDAFYAVFQEFGTESMVANPFFFPSYRKLKRRMKGRVSRAINNEFKRSSAK